MAQQDGTGAASKASPVAEQAPCCLHSRCLVVARRSTTLRPHLALCSARPPCSTSRRQCSIVHSSPRSRRYSCSPDRSQRVGPTRFHSEHAREATSQSPGSSSPQSRAEGAKVASSPAEPKGSEECGRTRWHVASEMPVASARNGAYQKVLVCDLMSRERGPRAPKVTTTLRVCLERCAEQEKPPRP